jgi:hypothetical protein
VCVRTVGVARSSKQKRNAAQHKPITRTPNPITKNQKREWPYEHIVPGAPKNDPPYRGGRQKGHARDHEREERQQRIAAAMAKMPQLIAEYRVRFFPGSGPYRARGWEGFSLVCCCYAC